MTSYRLLELKHIVKDINHDVLQAVVKHFVKDVITYDVLQATGTETHCQGHKLRRPTGCCKTLCQGRHSYKQTETTE